MELTSLMMTEVACMMPLYRWLPCMLCTVSLPRTMSSGYVALIPACAQNLNMAAEACGTKHWKQSWMLVLVWASPI